MLRYAFSLVLICGFIFVGGTAALAQRTYRTTVPNAPGGYPKPKEVRDLESRTERLMEMGKIPRPTLGPKIMMDEMPLVSPKEGEEGKKEEPGTGKPIKVYYQVAVNDKLYISVWRAPDLSMEYTVGPDGKISFPLIGDLDAAGRTLTELDDEITRRLKEYVHNPQVSVMIKEFAGDKVTVLGEIKMPGIYKFIGQTNVIDVVATAGGFTDRAKVAGLVIVRQPDDPEKKAELIRINAKNILKAQFNNIAVQPNDIIYVSRTFVSNLEEFYDQWIAPLVGTAIDVETFQYLERRRVKHIYN